MLRGTLTAVNLKPNFAYQLKLSGFPEEAPAANASLGFSGRWWKEDWNGSAWVNGWNLNNKGTGYAPTPNDVEYLDKRDVTNATSPTGLRYRFTGYRPFDYFITDANGNATLAFEMRDAYHVLYGSWQGAPGVNDGPMKVHSFDPDPAIHPAYDTDYPAVVDRGVFGEWERLPKGKIYIAPGEYHLDFLLTEESFHESGLGGWWAHAAHGAARFTVVRPVIAIRVEPAHGGTLSGDGAVEVDCGASTNILITPAIYWTVTNVWVNGISQGPREFWSFVEVVSNQSLTAAFNPLMATNAVPRWWLAQRNPAWADDFDAASQADADGDGMPTWAEYQAGTDPADSNSVFRVEAASIINGTNRIVWRSPANDPALPPFRVMRSTNLVAWTLAGLAERSADGTNVWQECRPLAPLAPAYYRITATNRFE